MRLWRQRGTRDKNWWKTLFCCDFFRSLLCQVGEYWMLGILMMSLFKSFDSSIILNRCFDSNIILKRWFDSSIIIKRWFDSSRILKRCFDSSRSMKRCFDSSRIIKRCYDFSSIMTNRYFICDTNSSQNHSFATFRILCYFIWYISIYFATSTMYIDYSK